MVAPGWGERALFAGLAREWWRSGALYWWGAGGGEGEVIGGSRRDFQGPSIGVSRRSVPLKRLCGSGAREPGVWVPGLVLVGGAWVCEGMVSCARRVGILRGWVGL